MLQFTTYIFLLFASAWIHEIGHAIISIIFRLKFHRFKLEKFKIIPNGTRVTGLIHGKGDTPLNKTIIIYLSGLFASLVPGIIFFVKYYNFELQDLFSIIIFFVLLIWLANTDYKIIKKLRSQKAQYYYIIIDKFEIKPQLINEVDYITENKVKFI